MKRILLIDDHEVVRAGLKRIFDKQPGTATFGEASTAPEALQLAREQDWRDEHIIVGRRLASTYAHALALLLSESRRTVQVTVRSLMGRKALLIAGAVFAAVARHPLCPLPDRDIAQFRAGAAGLRHDCAERGLVDPGRQAAIPKRGRSQFHVPKHEYRTRSSVGPDG